MQIVELDREYPAGFVPGFFSFWCQVLLRNKIYNTQRQKIIQLYSRTATKNHTIIENSKRRPPRRARERRPAGRAAAGRAPRRCRVPPAAQRRPPGRWAPRRCRAPPWVSRSALYCSSLIGISTTTRSSTIDLNSNLSWNSRAFD